MLYAAVQLSTTILLKGHLNWTMNIIECASLNARFTKLQKILLSTLSTCQSIDSKSIQTNRNSGFFKLSLMFA